MADRLLLRFPFPAKPKARPRFGGGRAYNDSKYEQWKAQVREHALKVAGKVELTGPLSCDIVLYQDSFTVALERIPEGQEYVRSDIDNAGGGIMDALQPKKAGGLGLYENDRQIRELNIRVARKDETK